MTRHLPPSTVCGAQAYLSLAARRWHRLLVVGWLVGSSVIRGDASPGSSAPAWTELGSAVVQRYPIDLTGVNGRPYVIQQLADRQMAIGTDRGLHLYDGRRWQDVRGHSGVHSIEPVSDGRFFLGSGSEIYGFEPDGRGDYQSRPLTRGLLRDRPDSIVTSLSYVRGTLYGLDGPRIIGIPASGEPFLVPLPTWCTDLFQLNGQLYVRADSPDHGLLRFDAEQRTIVSAKALIPEAITSRLMAQTRDPQGAMWFAAEDGTVFRTDGVQSRIMLKVTAPTGGAVEIHAIQTLPRGHLAVATVDQGVLLFDAAGRQVERTNEDAAVPRGRVYALGTDLEGGLWLGAALELTRIDGYLSARTFGELEGVLGEVWAIARHAGRLYVGTDAGLFVENLAATARSNAFVPVPSVAAVKALLDTPDGLWISSTHVLLLAPDGSLQDFGPATADPNPLVRPRGHPEMLLAGVREGLVVFRRGPAGWAVQGRVPGVERPVFSLAETTRGDIWASLGTGAVARVRLKNPKAFEVRHYGEADGIPNLWVHFGGLGSELYLGSDKGTLKWDEPSDRFVLTTEVIYYGIFEPIGFDPVFNNEHEIWTWPQTTVGTLVPRPPAEALAAMAVATGHVRARSRALWRDSDNAYWIGLPRGVLRYSAPGDANPVDSTPPLLLRRVVDLRTGESIAGRIVSDHALTLPHRQNSVRVEVAMPRFRGERFAQFRIEMQGVDAAQPSAGVGASREFVNLSPGDYQLVMHGIDAAGREATPLRLALHVLAPWYATGWAYLGYVLGAGALVAGFVRWRVAHLDRRAGELQRAVQERTIEISRQSALLQEEKELFVSLAAAAPVGIWRGESDGSIVLVNAALEQITGRTRGRLLQEGWLTSLHPEDVESGRELMRTSKHENAAMSAELRVLRPEGELRWVIVGVAPVRGVAENGEWFVGTALDVTERREVERRMMRAQRLESIGTLTGGIAHDLNNALVPIVAGVSLLEDDSAADRQALLSDIERSAKRAAGMVRQLLAFARGMDGQRVPVDLVSVLTDLGRILERTFPKNITQHYETPAAAAWIKGDPTQLHQVFLNLCVNARDAMPQGGKISLQTITLRVERAQDAFQAPIPAGEYRVVRVQDTGAGIPPHVLEHIFDPFFTTKEPDRGTGLGLSTSLGIVRSHGGFIAVETAVGAGTTFSVYLPAIAAPTEPNDAPLRTATAPLESPALALVVDDEATIRSVVQRSFERLKLRVITAADGREGLQRWTEHRGEIGLLAIDLHMPEMDGVALVRAIRAQNTRVPIIVFSGNLSEDQRRELHALNVGWVMHKPFRFDDLATAVRSALS